MKQMNQILLEGIISKKSKQLEQKDGRMSFSFKLANIQEYKNSAGEKREFVYDFTIITTGKMAEIVSKKRLGAGLRVVGALSVTSAGKTVVNAEHIDFKPD